MKDIPTNGTPLRANKFITLNLVENNVVLINKNKEETIISFSELNKIYIQKYRFSFLNKIGLLSILLIPTVLFFIYLPIEVVSLASIISIIFIAKLNTYKRYQLCLFLINGTFFIKDFKHSTKQDNINILNGVRKKIFENQIRLNIQNETPLIKMTIGGEYLFRL
jgi:hypothetical protein